MFRFSPGFAFLFPELDGVWDISQIISLCTSVMLIHLVLCKHKV